MGMLESTDREGARMATQRTRRTASPATTLSAPKAKAAAEGTARRQRGLQAAIDRKDAAKPAKKTTARRSTPKQGQGKRPPGRKAG